MRYFIRNVITREHVDNLKSSLKKYTKNKIINYKENYIEHSILDKGILVTDKDNEILKLIEDHLEPWLDEWYVLQKQIEFGRWDVYDFYKLPRKLQKYMISVDGMLHARWWSDIMYKPSVDDYDRREQQLKNMIPDYTEDEYDRYVLLGHRLPSTLGKKARDSARRSYKLVNEIIKCNINKFEQFLTFTFANENKKKRHLALDAARSPGEESTQFEYIDGKDFEEAKRKFSLVMQALGKKLKRRGIPFVYIAVWELQTNGNYHFHVLCSRIPKEELYDVPEWLDVNHLENKRYFGQGLSHWKYGKSDVQEIKDRARLTTYVSKYIIKSFQNFNEDTYNEYLNKKKYFPSKGLDRPDVKYFSEDEEIEIDVAGIEPYVKTYTNPYNDGLITKKLYTKVV